MTGTFLPQRRAILASLAALVAMTAVPGAYAAESVDSYPSKPIRLIVPYPAGGGTDMMARLVANHMSQQWKQTVVVENVAGAAGQLGLNTAARAAPDGYTIALGISSFLQAPYLYRNLPYDVHKDFAPISVLAFSTNLWLVPAGSPIQSFQQLVDEARKNPGKLSYGSYGAGTSAHLHMERVKRALGIDMTHVPYKGAAPLLNDTLGGHVNVGVVDVTTATPHVTSGKVRVLAVDGARRVPTAKDAPLLSEVGVEGVGSNGWFAFLAPAGTPQPIVDKLSTEINRIIRTPEMQEAFQGLSLMPGGTTSQEMAARMQKEGPMWGQMIRDINLTLD